ncbi:MAG: efflux RND transporter periplasmic adaptor subunit, partial [Asticcacaulis sp.]
LGGVKAQTLAQLTEAEALVDQARLDLDRTVLRAPRAGVVGGRAVREGLYVRPGQQLMQLVPLGQTYVVANFKETQVAKLAIGQSVSLHADAFPGKTLKGQVDSFAPATGSEFALIPIENATGNFTKIVQRVPVRIAVDPRDPLAAALRPGLSIKVTVDTKSQGTTGFAEAARIPPAMASRSERP